MSSKTVELRPDRSLLDPNFDGYKLSLQDVEILQQTLDVAPDRVLPDINSYSLLHARLFGLHNHLVGDSVGDIDSVYFIDKSLKVLKTYKDAFAQRLVDCIEVWEIPKKRERLSGDYNVSFRFVSDTLAVLADGVGTLYVLNTGDRNDDLRWTQVFFGEIIGADKKFQILDAVYKENSSTPELHLLLFNITQEANERCSTLIHWVTLSKVQEKWGQVALRQLKSNGNVHYCYFERNCEAVYAISDNNCKFILDSENPIQEKTEADREKIVKYTWTQNKENITIKYKLDDTCVKTNIKVETTPDSIKMQYNETNLLHGQLYGRIDSDLTTWTFENNVLQVMINKDEAGAMWPEFVIGDPFGEYILDTCIVEEAKQVLGNLTSENEATPQSGTTFNSQEIEECDFEDDKSSIFERLSCTTHEVTHKAILGSNQILLTVSLSQDVPPAVGIRHDVDVCLWQPEIIDNEFTIKHKGTLNAFGYIQASKQQRKFTVCPPDLSYAVICESRRHLFVYRQNKPVSSGILRNRTSGERIKSIAQQQVITIPNDEVIGIYACSSILFLLTEKAVLGILI